MELGGPGDVGQVEVPHLVGMTVTAARQVGHEACLVVVSADPDGPPLGGLSGPGSGSSPLSAQCLELGYIAGTTW